MLNLFRGTHFAKGMSVLALTSFLTTSCGKEQVNNIKPTAEVASHYTGEQLFKGIFLLEGDVTNKIPYLHAFRSAVDKQKASNPEKAKTRQAMAQALTEKVKQLDPHYFNELKSAISSQNFDQIQSALQHGGLLVEAATLESYNTRASKLDFMQKQQKVKSIDTSKYDFSNHEDVEKFIKEAKGVLSENGESNRAPSDALDVVNVTDIALFLYFAASVAVVAVLVVVVGQDHNEDNASKLEKEQFVQQLATNLN